MSAVETLLSIRGQTVVPAELRRKYQLREGDRLVWLDDGGTLRVIPLPADPIAALRGRGKGQGLLGKLLANRKRDRAREP
jgi:bifunctional DNA-binding transcriptional regulator/antitoxin component of YhaV-PrlF toxin-antitoxin module